jgi:hypothetical protein
MWIEREVEGIHWIEDERRVDSGIVSLQYSSALC